MFSQFMRKSRSGNVHINNVDNFGKSITIFKPFRTRKTAQRNVVCIRYSVNKLPESGKKISSNCEVRKSLPSSENRENATKKFPCRLCKQLEAF